MTDQIRATAILKLWALQILQNFSKTCFLPILFPPLLEHCWKTWCSKWLLKLEEECARPRKERSLCGACMLYKLLTCQTHFHHQMQTTCHCPQGPGWSGCIYASGLALYPSPTSATLACSLGHEYHASFCRWGFALDVSSAQKVHPLTLLSVWLPPL